MKQFDKDNIVAGPYFDFEDIMAILRELDEVKSSNPDLFSEDFSKGFVAAMAFICATEDDGTYGMKLGEFIENGLMGIKKRDEVIELIEALPFPLNLIVADGLNR